MTNTDTKQDELEAYEWLDELLRTVAVETCVADRQSQVATRPNTINDANVSFNHAILRGKHKIIETFTTLAERKVREAVAPLLSSKDQPRYTEKQLQDAVREARISTLKKLKSTKPNAEPHEATPDYLRGYREMEAKVGFELHRIESLKEKNYE